MFQGIQGKIFDLLFYAGIGAIIHFVLPVVTEFINTVSGIDTSFIVAVKDAMLVWSAVWLCSKRNHQT